MRLSSSDVRRQAQEITGSGRMVLDPKSEAGRRTVALPAIVVDALDRHMAAFPGLDADAPLFTGPAGGPLRRATFSRVWRAAVAATGAPAELRPHDVRHHAATLTARMPGITTKELMARIGHASPRAALIYLHATQERDLAVAAYLDEIVAASKPAARADVLGLRHGHWVSPAQALLVRSVHQFAGDLTGGPADRKGDCRLPMELRRDDGDGLLRPQALAGRRRRRVPPSAPSPRKATKGVGHHPSPDPTLTP